ncbi:MAG: hypothetical protein NC038_00075 [Paludibacter sp.]|nr:hypothetical protein [Bacteroidales bacterium]MCM1068765.1 hypothetical protein [Prevotella sp.]MCM1354477.1 hypothetical protein [Bacteroides sp.]MCM1443280.1 hypothetical protein [Muribaculum sp.]MCM1481035.1 hypothetical protein [Paludibacter sp.]
MKRIFFYAVPAIACLCLASCQPNTEITDNPKPQEMPDWYYAGGKLGTAYLATSNALEQPTEPINEGFYESFKRGEAIFEKPFMSNLTGTRSGLGPLYVRQSCIHCHPGYSHGESVPEGTYNSVEVGNGTLLVVYNKATEAYVTWLAGMPQLHGVGPFKAPLDESQITVTWKEATDDWGNTFPDNETYSLRYPEVTLPAAAVYVFNQGFTDLGDYGVKLENTIGIYGTGLLDAIPEEDIIAQWAQEEQDNYFPLNTAFFEGGQWKNFYTNSLQGDGTPYVRRFTYALSRGPLQDAAGANAIWNITNVTRSDRRYHYLDLNGTIYATYASKDPEVQDAFPAYIEQVDPKHEHADWFTDDVEHNIYAYLTAKDLPVEMTDQEYTDLMVWHRGLAVPAVRNIDSESVQKGKELFSEIGCAYCHRPSWTTGDDNIVDPARFFRGNELPRYPHQTIWPYTDMVQHRLYMENDIRTGWCRTTPLWGRGLHQRCTGDAFAARLHDTRARNAMEAIMWHGYSPQSDARRSVERFRQLDKEERQAICDFVDAI